MHLRYLLKEQFNKKSNKYKKDRQTKSFDNIFSLDGSVFGVHVSALSVAWFAILYILACSTRGHVRACSCVVCVVRAPVYAYGMSVRVYGVCGMCVSEDMLCMYVRVCIYVCVVCGMWVYVCGVFKCMIVSVCVLMCMSDMSTCIWQFTDVNPPSSQRVQIWKLTSLKSSQRKQNLPMHLFTSDVIVYTNGHMVAY